MQGEGWCEGLDNYALLAEAVQKPKLPLGWKVSLEPLETVDGPEKVFPCNLLFWLKDWKDGHGSKKLVEGLNFHCMCKLHTYYYVHVSEIDTCTCCKDTLWKVECY